MLDEKIKRSLHKTLQIALEVADKFRRRKTEVPRLVGWRKKNQVVVGHVEKIVIDGKNVFVTMFVAPRKGSQFNPYWNDHHITLSLEAGCHQVAMASIKKFEKLSGVIPTVTMSSFKWKKKIAPTQSVRIEGRLNEERFLSGKQHRVYGFRIVDSRDLKRVFANGTITLTLVPKA